MKRYISIVFLSIFLTYHIGYYGVYLVMWYKIESQWKQKVSGAGLSVHELNKISTPLSLPYSPDQQEYQEASGSIQIEGKFYRFVKYRYAQDSLHLLYVKDNKMEQLHNVLRDWAVSFTSIPISKNGSVELWKSMSKDFIFWLASAMKAPNGVDWLGTFDGYLDRWLSLFIQVPSPPPKIG
ncbi:hypothetical protein JMN32_21230 [Fulvivirga sp. 29W222]|uniref:Uncharacterized protein n=1 Tax=Fulvivirga marina TaxID=2494733 RepID=A0A937KDV1_9BACT|nr:hypothetical protein [Fulvivirga marina]MBL6448849.1 hypothetical protein [Fulvivirga marina]